MTDKPVDLDSRRGIAAQKATTLRRTLAEAESTAATLREKQMQIETELRNAPAATWSDAALKARYVLNLYSAALAPQDTHHRDLVESILSDFERLDAEQ